MRLMLSAGGKKSTYVREGTLHLPTKAHLPFFISFHGKKSRRVLFEQPSYIASEGLYLKLGPFFLIIGLVYHQHRLI